MFILVVGRRAGFGSTVGQVGRSPRAHEVLGARRGIPSRTSGLDNELDNLLGGGGADASTVGHRAGDRRAPPRRVSARRTPSFVCHRRRQTTNLVVAQIARRR